MTQALFVAAARIEETHYGVSRRFLLQVPNDATAIFCPILIMPECAAAIARPTADAALAQELVALVAGFPNMQLVPLDLPMGRRAVDIAAHHRLKGADAVYVAVAEAFKIMVGAKTHRSSQCWRPFSPSILVEPTATHRAA